MRKPRGYARIIRNVSTVQGLIVQPTNLSQDQIASVMREGRKRMVERYGTSAINESVQMTQEHIERTKRGVRI
ncbi:MULTISPECIES: hypothetical protein [unclassified Cohnella]|jgi:hypothetical protein|uniref:hypothetical protein n=1 Tax=unclassified Cohnella TaxID=2636738 RepID=UPI00117CF571|nr:MULTISPECIES: hypothetical protein [unclassified Cohnella]